MYTFRTHTNICGATSYRRRQACVLYFQVSLALKMQTVFLQTVGIEPQVNAALDLRKPTPSVSLSQLSHCHRV
jgi:hypothetical protein